MDDTKTKTTTGAGVRALASFPGSAELEITVDTVGQRRAITVLLAGAKAVELRAMGWSSNGVAFYVAGIGCKAHLGEPVTARVLRSMRPTVRACLKAAGVKDWELDRLEQDPVDLDRVLCRLKRPKAGV